MRGTIRRNCRLRLTGGAVNFRGKSAEMPTEVIYS
jgi:hypothetical protein